LPKAQGLAELGPAVTPALKACPAGLTGAGAPKSARRNFSLAAPATWAGPLTTAKDPERWGRGVAPPPRVLNGVSSIPRYIEYYGTGGGLGRPMMAEFLAEAAGALKQPALKSLSTDNAALGRAWSDLADAALPDDVTEFAEAKKLMARSTELF